MKTLKGQFELASWDETTYLDLGGDRKLTKASVSQNLTGDMTGSGAVEYLMCYVDGGTARFLGLQRVEGSVDGREGSFVVEAIGAFDGERASGTWSVVPGSGAGDLDGIRGEGSFEAPIGSTGTYQLDATLD